MNKVIDKDQCCGCTACINICPRGAIEMLPDEEGFLFPEILQDVCVDCGLCKKMCPVLNKVDSAAKPEAFLCRSKDADVLETSSSGGAFTPIAKYVLERKGIVFGVGFDENWVVCHKQAKNIEELVEFRGSKYIQS